MRGGHPVGKAGTNVPAARRGRLRANRGRLRAKRETSAPAPQGVGNGFTMVNNGAAGSAAGPGPRKGAGELRGLVGARRSPSAQLQARCDPALLSSHAEADRTYGYATYGKGGTTAHDGCV